jgi:hypothetical protein
MCELNKVILLQGKKEEGKSSFQWEGELGLCFLFGKISCIPPMKAYKEIEMP